MTIVGRAVVLSVFPPSMLLFLGCSSTEPFSCTPGDPITAKYDYIGTFQSDTVSERGITVTGSNNVNVLDVNGLGIVGGFQDNTIDGIDGTESIRFDFDNGPVSEVSYEVTYEGSNVSDPFIGDATIEAFDRMGKSLGTMPVSLAIMPGMTYHKKFISTVFGNEPLSAFVVTAAADNFFRIARVEYTPCE